MTTKELEKLKKGSEIDKEIQRLTDILSEVKRCLSEVNEICVDEPAGAEVTIELHRKDFELPIGRGDFYLLYNLLTDYEKRLNNEIDMKSDEFAAL